MVVVVRVADWDADDSATMADLIAGDLDQNATMVLVQEGSALHYVSKHARPGMVGAPYMTERTLRETLLRLQRKYNGERQDALREGTDVGIGWRGIGDSDNAEPGDQRD